MYPQDNIFNIYYNIGRRVPFQVKRTRTMNVDFRYNKEGRTFMVERVEPRGQYGKAYGYCLVDNVRNDEYMKESYPDNNGEIPCAGCGGWTLIDVPGASMNEIFPVHKADETISFGKHKGKTFAEIYNEDPQYIFWLMQSDPFFKVDLSALTGIALDDEKAEEKFSNEIDRVFPKVKIEDAITFGKYKGKTYKEVFAEDSQYIEWFVRNNDRLDLDIDSFRSLLQNGTNSKA